MKSLNRTRLHDNGPRCKQRLSLRGAQVLSCRRVRFGPQGGLFCFSPPVMLATFTIEIILLAYTLWRYKMSPLVRLVALLFFFLAVFQLAEYMVCGGLGLRGLDWSRIGFVAITLLPPLGLHIAHVLAGKQNKVLLSAAYATSLAFVVYFAFATSALEGNVCHGNYVIFELSQGTTLLYSLFYYGWVVMGLVLSWLSARQATSAKQRRALYAFAIGYASFLLPTTTVNILAPETISGIPSIMCGFAVLLVLAISGWVLPYIAKRRRA